MSPDQESNQTDSSFKTIKFRFYSKTIKGANIYHSKNIAWPSFKTTITNNSNLFRFTVCLKTGNKLFIKSSNKIQTLKYNMTVHKIVISNL